MPIMGDDKYSNRTINDWVANLPKGNIGETSRLIYQFLNQSNKHLIEAERRSYLLEKINATANLITDSMKKHYLGMSISLSEKQQKIANFTQALDVEIAIAYKTIIEDLIVDEKYQHKQLINAVNACLHYFYKIQTRAYQLYRDLPSGMWHEIHILYQLAEQNQFHQNKINYCGESLSIYTTYKNILLLATINPNQLRQSEITQLSNCMGKAGHLASLDADQEATHDFLINIKSDSGPFHQSLMNGELKGTYRGLSLANLIDTLEQELQHKAVNQRLLKLDDQTQRHLLKSWGSMTTRTFARVNGEGELTIAVGLTASHYLINSALYGDEEEPEVELTGEQLIDSLEGSLKNAVILGGDDNDGMITRPSRHLQKKGAHLQIPNSLTDNSLWDAMYRNSSVQSTENPSSPYQFMNANDSKTSRYETGDATIINISPGGFCLQLNAPLPKQTQTGEIIGLLEQDAEDTINWHVGTIRWMRRKRSGELEIGVQLIAPNAIPIKAQLRTSHSSDNYYQRCLQLPPIDGIGQPETLLTSPLPFKEQSKVRIQTDDGDVDVLLVNEVASGHSYKQFTFDKLESSTFDTDNDINDDFDSVWKLV